MKNLMCDYLIFLERNLQSKPNMVLCVVSTSEEVLVNSFVGQSHLTRTKGSL